MKQSKSGNEVGSNVKATKYAFLPPGAIGKGRGRGFRSICSLGVSRNEVGSFCQDSFYAGTRCQRMQTTNATRSNAFISDGQAMQITKKNYLVPDKEQMQTDIKLPPTTDILLHLSKKKKSQVPEKELMDTDIQLPPSTNILFHPSEKKVSQFLEKDLMQNDRQLPPSTDQLFLLSKKKSSQVREKEMMQTDVQLPPSMDELLHLCSCTAGKVKKVRGRNKCKQVASLEVGEKLKVTFYNNRTVGKNSALFSRHLGIVVCDRNMCPLGVSSWNDIKEEKLNHMWAAIEDKFQSDDMDIHRDHIFRWMKELWNRWRGQLHAKFVRGMPIQEALKNVPHDIDKKQWEWLVEEYFSSQSFQAQIQEFVRSEPTLPSIEIVEKCFGPQKCSHVVGFGGGVKAKDLKGGTSSNVDLLSKLRSSREENKCLKDWLSAVENGVKELKQLKELLLAQYNGQPATSTILGE